MKKLIFTKFLKDVTSFFLLTAISMSLIVWVIQAVNYLEFVSEDGHSFKVYFMYTILNLPKVFSRILPFMFFLSLFYILTKYEEDNELIIFWLHGVKKMDFYKKLINYSLIYFFIQICLTAYIVPKSQDIARSYIRTSTLDFFPTLIKEKKFIDTVSKLTIYVDEKRSNGDLYNIFLKDYISSDESQIIYAERGIIAKKNLNHFLILYNGQIINHKKRGTNIFTFDQTQFNLSKYSTKTTTFPKIQELDTVLLLKCINSLVKNEEHMFKSEYLICNQDNSQPITTEIFRRIYLPLYLPILASIVCFLTLTSRDKFNYKSYKLNIFLLSSVTIVLSELSVRFFGLSLNENILFMSFPIILFLISFGLYTKKINYN